MEQGDPFCSICATGGPVQIQHFSVGAAEGELSFLTPDGHFRC